MKERATRTLILLALFFAALTGCESFDRTLDKNLGIINLKPQRPVVNNLFTSTFPELKLQMNRELKYLGTVMIEENTDERMGANTDPREYAFQADSYLFVQTDPGKRIAKGVLIRMLVTHGDPSQPIPEVFTRENQNILESGETKILKDTYHYEVYTEPELFVPKERGLLKGIRVPRCLLVKQLWIKAGLGNKSRIQVLYFEDPSSVCGTRSCGTCLARKDRTEEQKRYFQEFTDRSYASIRFQETKTVEDSTSRYVDTVPKGRPAPSYEQAPPVAESAETLERRLEALKRLRDKNLISEEDFEKKKADLLKEL